MARPKTQFNRKTEIMDAAEKLFSEKGFEKTTVDEIAKYIGIGKGTVYLDFKNKDDILQAIIERNINAIFEKIDSLIKDAKPPYLELLRQIIQNDVLTVFDTFTSQIHTHVALMYTSYQFKLNLSHLMERGQKLTARLLKIAADNGEIKSFSEYTNLAYLITVTLQGFFPPYDLKYSMEHRKDFKKEEIRELLYNDLSLVIDLILSGLKVTERVS